MGIDFFVLHFPGIENYCWNRVLLVFTLELLLFSAIMTWDYSSVINAVQFAYTLHFCEPAVACIPLRDHLLSRVWYPRKYTPNTTLIFTVLSRKLNCDLFEITVFLYVTPCSLKVTCCVYLQGMRLTPCNLVNGYQRFGRIIFGSQNVTIFILKGMTTSKHHMKFVQLLAKRRSRIKKKEKERTHFTNFCS
jgi:hypothetical protein